MAQAQLETPKQLFIPLTSEVWTAPDTEYSYDETQGIGTWDGTNFASVYAPESGDFRPQLDGTWVIRVAAKDHIREWVSLNPLDGIISSSPRSIDGGRKIGTSNGVLRLALWITPTGENKSTSFDPAKTLIYFKAKFPDVAGAEKQREEAKQPTPSPLAKAPSNSQQIDRAPAGAPSFGPFPDRRFTTGQAAVLAGGALFLGGFVVWLAK